MLAASEHAERFHAGTVGDGMRAVIEEVERGYRSRILRPEVAAH